MEFRIIYRCDAIYRGRGQIIHMIRRAYYASEIAASPKYQEPVYLCDISAPSEIISGI